MVDQIGKKGVHAAFCSMPLVLNSAMVGKRFLPQ
jgi:hypothetical protein